MVGFDAKNKHILDPKFTCSFCSLILCNPVQLTECGHRQCRSCIDIQNGTTIKCPECSVETQRIKMMIDRGFKRDMQSMLIECSFCQWNDVLNNYQKHLDDCHCNPKCEYCEKQFNSVDSLNQHKVTECQKMRIYCKIKDYGCTEKIFRDQIEEHYISQQHQKSLVEIIRLMQLQLHESRMNIDLSRTTTTTTTSGSATGQSQKLYQTMGILADNINTLNKDEQRLSNKSLNGQIQLPTLTDNIPAVQSSIEESNGILQGVKHNQNRVLLKEKINDIQYISSDGGSVWKITNFKEKMMDAQSERQTSIYSPPLYSSPAGYKMRVRLYLHGDGKACRSHMSLFFVLMRGMNDPILNFPFNYKVTFCMYDQTGGQRHIIDSFRPDIKSNSFQRPLSQMNIASGIPKFAPLSTILQEGNPYVRDDTMFIKIMVDFDDMPEALLPYAVSLNPGIPIHIRQTMIMQEMERRAKQ